MVSILTTNISLWLAANGNLDARHARYRRRGVGLGIAGWGWCPVGSVGVTRSETVAWRWWSRVDRRSGGWDSKIDLEKTRWGRTGNKGMARRTRGELVAATRPLAIIHTWGVPGSLTLAGVEQTLADDLLERRVCRSAEASPSHWFRSGRKLVQRFKLGASSRNCWRVVAGSWLAVMRRLGLAWWRTGRLGSGTCMGLAGRESGVEVEVR